MYSINNTGHDVFVIDMYKYFPFLISWLLIKAIVISYFSFFFVPYLLFWLFAAVFLHLSSFYNHSLTYQICKKIKRIKLFKLLLLLVRTEHLLTMSGVKKQ